MKEITFAILFLINLSSFSQIGSIIPTSKRVDWRNAGYQGKLPRTYDHVIDLREYSIQENQDIHFAIDQAMKKYSDGWVLIYIPPGNYHVSKPISITRNNTVIKGAGSDYTHLDFKFTGSSCVLIKGSISSVKTRIIAGTNKGSTKISVESITSNMVKGAYGKISIDDYSWHGDFTSGSCWSGEKSVPSYANNVIGQIVKIKDVLLASNQLNLDYELSDYFPIGQKPVISILSPKENIGIEDLKITRNVTSGSKDSNISYSFASNCWLYGVELGHTKKHSVEIYNSSSITIFGCVMNKVQTGESNNYGIQLALTSTNCLIENNIISNNSTGVLMSLGVNKNVVGYNYFHSNHRRGFGLHGFYPFSNLFEGNVVETSDGVFAFGSDHDWGKNGPYNTYFRNEVKGTKNRIYIRRAAYTNHIGNSGDGSVLWSISGCENSKPTSIYSYNSSNGGTAFLSDISYYKEKRPEFIENSYTWPPTGRRVTSHSSLSGKNPAYQRGIDGGQMTVRRGNLPANLQPSVSYKNIGLISGFQSSAPEISLYYNNDQKSIGRKIYNNTSGYWSLAAIATGDIDGDGDNEMLTCFNSSGGAAVYLSQNFASIGTRIYGPGSGFEITAITTGDFNRDGKDEIITAMTYKGKARIYKTSNYVNLTQEKIYSKTGTWWKVSALTTGDFDNDGDDELIAGFISPSNSVIWRNESGTNSGWAQFGNFTNKEVVALTTGQFKGNSETELIIGLNTNTGSEIYKSNNLYSIGTKLFHAPTYRNFWKIKAITSGDFDSDCDDELVVGFDHDFTVDPLFDASEVSNVIYKSESAEKIDQIKIYKKTNKYWNISALAVRNKASDTCSKKKNNLSLSGCSQVEIITFPNPSKGIFMVNYNSSIAKKTIRVIDSTGKNIRFTHRNINEKQIEIDISNQPDGIYFILINNLQAKLIKTSSN